MLSTEECKKHLAGITLTDKQVEDLRDALYALVENVLDEYVKSSDIVIPTCKKQSSIAEYLPTDKQTKDMASTAKNIAVGSMPNVITTK
ncbi:MAG TPA: hypothetical protein VJJ24_02880 [Candidatus Paceibacterota bacterium]